MGTRTNTSIDTFGLYFSGHLVFEAVLESLSAQMAGASDILITGDSAGGIGTWTKVDYLRNRFPNARVTGAPLAGMYFYAFPYTGPNATHSILAPFDPPGIDALFSLYRPYLNEDCVAAYTAMGLSPSPCMLGNYSQLYVKSDMFVTEAQTDSVQLEDHDDIPGEYVHLPPEQEYLAAWKANMTQALSRFLDPSQPRLGAFHPACYIHTSFSPSKPLIKGESFLKAASSWYSASGDPSQYKLSDGCGIMCNPTCP